MDNKFSWYTIETDEKHAYLYLNNKKGLHKLEIKTRIENISRLEESKEKRQALRDRIGKEIAEAVKWGMENPEEFKKRMERK